jgi:hypothetical protein
MTYNLRHDCVVGQVESGLIGEATRLQQLRCELEFERESMLSLFSDD